MFETLRVRNFKALRDIEIPLRPFTVLIGPNDSGKSSILEALHILHLLATEGGSVTLEHLFGEQPDRMVYRGEAERRVAFEVEGATREHGRFSYAVEFALEDSRFAIQEDMSAGGVPFGESDTRRLRGRGNSLLPIISECRTHGEPHQRAAAIDFDAQIVRFQAGMLRRGCALHRQPVLDAYGFGLAAVFDAMITGPNRATIDELEHQLRALVPSVRGVSLVTTPVPTVYDDRGPITGKALELVLAAESGGRPVIIPVDQASDGVVLALGYLALAYGQDAGRLLVEEPENGLHPSALGFVVDLLQKMARGEVGGRPRQVILTTHSPLLLNFVDPEDVLIIKRQGDDVTATPMTETRHFAEHIQDFDLGELWYNVGEDQLVE